MTPAEKKFVTEAQSYPFFEVLYTREGAPYVIGPSLCQLPFSGDVIEIPNRENDQSIYRLRADTDQKYETNEKLNEVIRGLFREAFFLGFAVTREGFNAECPYEHLAPAKLVSPKGTHRWASTEELRDKMEAMPEFIALRDQMEEEAKTEPISMILIQRDAEIKELKDQIEALKLDSIKSQVEINDAAQKVKLANVVLSARNTELFDENNRLRAELQEHKGEWRFPGTGKGDDWVVKSPDKKKAYEELVRWFEAKSSKVVEIGAELEKMRIQRNEAAADRHKFKIQVEELSKINGVQNFAKRLLNILSAENVTAFFRVKSLITKAAYGNLPVPPTKKPLADDEDEIERTRTDEGADE